MSDTIDRVPAFNLKSSSTGIAWPGLGDPRRLEDGVWWFGYQHARDISDELFLRAIDRATGVWAPNWAMREDVARVLGGLPIGRDINPADEVPGVPWKVVLAKFRRVRHRGLATGCDCSCRGDWEITSKGLSLLTCGMVD